MGICQTSDSNEPEKIISFSKNNPEYNYHIMLLDFDPNLIKLRKSNELYLEEKNS